MVTRARLDAELVRRGLARSRQQAAELIEQGRVAVRGVPAGKPATVVDRDTPVTVRDTGERRVGLPRRAQADRRAGRVRRSIARRAALPGRRRLHRRVHRRAAGPRRGREVVAVDVGYGQLVWRLRSDDAGAGARPHQRARARHPTRSAAPVELTVADLSFISLRTVLPALAACTAPDGELLPMVKPQFEVGSERLGAGGVVRDPALRRAALAEVAAAARGAGPACWRGAVASPLPGPSGNVEYFLLACAATRRRRRRRRRWTARRREDGSGVTREVLVVLHAGRATNRRTAAARRAPAGRARHPAAGARRGVGRGRRHGDLPRACSGRGSSRDGRAAPRAPRSCSCSAATARCCGPRSWPGPAGVPLLGVNLGHVGFLAEAEEESLDEALDAIAAGRYAVEERMTIDAVARAQRRRARPHLGAQRGRRWRSATRERILEVVLEVDGRPVSAFGCDGVLCATPTGSTAYAFSAGGPIVWPQVEALLLVPSNAHALFARPMVISPDSQVAIEVDPTGPPAVLDCDGRRTVPLPPGARVELDQGRDPVRMVRLDGRPFADRLVRKFDLPVRGWRGAPPPATDRHGRPVGARRTLRPMLAEMRIQGLGVIDDATLELDPGLTVLTGETGAGKTMVVTGLTLLGGGRAEASRVADGRRGAPWSRAGSAPTPPRRRWPTRSAPRPTTTAP